MTSRSIDNRESTRPWHEETNYGRNCTRVARSIFRAEILTLNSTDLVWFYFQPIFYVSLKVDGEFIWGYNWFSISITVTEFSGRSNVNNRVSLKRNLKWVNDSVSLFSVEGLLRRNGERLERKRNSFCNDSRGRLNS